MKRFRFPLRPVAVIRAHKELRAKEVFAAAIHTYVQAEERLATTRSRIAEMEETLFAGRFERYFAMEAAGLYRAYRGERQAELGVEREVIEARENMQKRRAEYLEAHRQLDVVKQLEEKARTRHRTEGLKLEQAQIDEFAGYAASRRTALS
jgi:flagellar FliJ protein